jgi:hypothetical protein
MREEHGCQVFSSVTRQKPCLYLTFTSWSIGIQLIKSLLLREIGANRRVLVCLDFAYGYPVDFAAALQAATGKSDRDLPWLIGPARLAAEADVRIPFG